MSNDAPGISDAVVVGPDEGRRLEMGPNSVKYKLEGDDVLSVVEYTAGPGWQPPYQGLGRHTRETSAVYVLDGELVYMFEDGEIKAPAGTLVHLPRGVWFAWRNDGTEPARFLVIFVPAGFEQMFTDMMTDLDDDADADAIAAVVAEHHTAYGMERHQ
jgi:quercetin dioxygenase-like cupin family protein